MTYPIDETHPIYWQVRVGLLHRSAFWREAERYNREHAERNDAPANTALGVSDMTKLGKSKA